MSVSSASRCQAKSSACAAFDAAARASSRYGVEPRAERLGSERRDAAPATTRPRLETVRADGRRGTQDIRTLAATAEGLGQVLFRVTQDLDDRLSIGGDSRRYRGASRAPRARPTGARTRRPSRPRRQGVERIACRSCSCRDTGTAGVRRSSSRSDRPLPSRGPCGGKDVRQTPTTPAPGRPAAPRRRTAGSRPARAAASRTRDVASARRRARRDARFPAGRVIRLVICVWCASTISATTSLCGVGYPLRSNMPSTDASGAFGLRQLRAPFSAGITGMLPMCLRAAGVAGHPPAAPSLLERAAVHRVEAVDVGLARRAADRHAATISPGTPSVSHERWQARHWSVSL